MDILIMGAAGMIGGKSTEQLAKGGALRSRPFETPTLGLRPGHGSRPAPQVACGSFR
jgi:nucleoside-diphosphate-sugar epimerase